MVRSGVGSSDAPRGFVEVQSFWTASLRLLMSLSDHMDMPPCAALLFPAPIFLPNLMP